MDFSQARINGRLRENHPKKGDVKGQTRARVHLSSRQSAMNYFTRQEMEGSVRYSGKCRIGNWNENDTLDEVRALTRRRVAKNQIRPAPSRVPSRTPVARAPRPPSLTHPFYRTISAGSPQGLHSQEGGRDAQDGQVQQAHGDRAPEGASRGVDAFARLGRNGTWECENSFSRSRS